MSVLGKIMEKLIRDLNDRDSKDRNIINANQHSFSEKYSLCSKPDFEWDYRHVDNGGCVDFDNIFHIFWWKILHSTASVKCIKNVLMDRSQKWDIIGNYYRTLKVLVDSGNLKQTSQIDWAASANQELEPGIPSGNQKNLDVFQTASETIGHFHQWSSCKYMN